MVSKTLQHFQSEVARKHGLGDSLVTGHAKKYFDEASEMYVDYCIKSNIDMEKETNNKILSAKEWENGQLNGPTSASTRNNQMERYSKYVTELHLRVLLEEIKNSYHDSVMGSKLPSEIIEEFKKTGEEYIKNNLNNLI